MSTKKQLAIWIDYLNAHVIEYTQGFIGKKVIFSGITNNTANNPDLKTSDSSLPANVNSKFSEYYNKLIAIIEKYDQVLLFGPTNAKLELNKILSTGEHSRHIKIELRSASKMTDFQEYDFVKEYFSVKGLYE